MNITLFYNFSIEWLSTSCQYVQKPNSNLLTEHIFCFTYLQNTHICLVNIQQTLWQRESRSAFLRDFPQFPLEGCQLSLWGVTTLPSCTANLGMRVANLAFGDGQLGLRRLSTSD